MRSNFFSWCTNSYIRKKNYKQMPAKREQKLILCYIIPVIGIGKRVYHGKISGIA